MTSCTALIYALLYPKIYQEPIKNTQFFGFLRLKVQVTGHKIRIMRQKEKNVRETNHFCVRCQNIGVYNLLKNRSLICSFFRSSSFPAPQKNAYVKHFCRQFLSEKLKKTRLLISADNFVKVKRKNERLYTFFYR